MRRGSVSERTMKCGKAGCPCQEDPKARHGPYYDYSLTPPMAGKTHSRYLSPEQAELAQQQIEQGHLREANRRGFTEAQRPVVLGDGLAWIRNSATELFPQTTQILDRFHAKEHLSQVGKVIYGDSPEAKPWIQARYDELDEGRLKCLVQALHRHAGQPQRGTGLCPLHLKQSMPNAISKVPQTRFLHFDWRGGDRL
jgi:hypothetical protein